MLVGDFANGFIGQSGRDPGTLTVDATPVANVAPGGCAGGSLNPQCGGGGGGGGGFGGGGIASRSPAKRGVGLADDVIHVTPSGVAFPPGSKYQIPKNYVENPHRTGSYGEMVNGKYVERLRIDPPTPPAMKGPNHSHYHLDGKGTHYSPRPGDKDPGFAP
jgi:hypothetical protein